MYTYIHRWRWRGPSSDWISSLIHFGMVSISWGNVYYYYYYYYYYSFVRRLHRDSKSKCNCNNDSSSSSSSSSNNTISPLSVTVMSRSRRPLTNLI